MSTKATFVMSIMLVTASMCLAAVNIPTDIPYGQDVEDWWATHVFNPESPNYDPDIISPSNQVTLNSGDSINTAIANLPASGGTIILNPGTYASFHLVRRSNIHIIAPSGATLTGTSDADGTDLSYSDFVVAIRVNRDPAALDDFFNKKTRNIYIKGVTFDGGASSVYAFYTDCSEGVLLEDCTIQNYVRHPRPEVANHLGMIGGCMGTNNVWYRNCTFKAYTPNPAGNAVYHDGIHAGGLINCTIESGFTGGGLLFLVNDDYTFDHNSDGELTQNEVRRTEYCVIYNCTFGANLNHATRMSSANSLVMNCTALGHINNSFSFFNPKTSLIYPDAKYYYYGNKLIGNVVQGGTALLEANNDSDYEPPGQNNKGQIGKFTVKGNITNGMTYLLQKVGQVDEPNIVCGNCFNDPGCTPDPDCDGSGDTSPPTRPGTPTADEITDTTVAISWTASTDDVAVAGYVIYRNGQSYATSEQTTWTDEFCEPITQYTYQVLAYDFAANESELSEPLAVTTDAPPPNADLNGDCKVTAADYSIMTRDWLATGQLLAGDTNFDNVVDINDKGVMLTQWLDDNMLDLIINGSFEDGVMAPWSNPLGGGAGSLLYDPAISYTGDYCFHAIGDPGYAYIDQDFNSNTPMNLEPGTTYTIQCMVRLDNPVGGDGKDGGFIMRFVELDPAVVIHRTQWYTTDTGGEWIRASREFTTSTGYNSGRLDALWDHSAGDIYIDDIQILICNQSAAGECE